MEMTLVMMKLHGKEEKSGKMNLVIYLLIDLKKARGRYCNGTEWKNKYIECTRETKLLKKSYSIKDLDDLENQTSSLRYRIK